MKVQILIASLVMVASGFAFAHGDTVRGSGNLCPLYKCAAVSDEGGFRDPQYMNQGDIVSGAGLANTVADAKVQAIAECSQRGGALCQVVECKAYHGPQIPIFSSCQDQWATRN